ncbi:class I SAM-dependent methyltransferase [Deltaproteobacteria bacterium TL4]
MKVEEKNSLIRLYENRYDSLGYHVKTVGWGSLKSQLLRFQILSEMANFTNATICDIGCGFGDLYPFLQNRFGNISYVGIDLSEKLIQEAKNRYSEAQFLVQDILETRLEAQSFDYILCSGALNYRISDNLSYLQKMLQVMFDACKKGVSVNFLSSYVDYETEKNFHMRPEDAFSMGKQLTRWITLRHDYPLYEFTLYLYRDQNNQEKLI